MSDELVRVIQALTPQLPSMTLEQLRNLHAVVRAALQTYAKVQGQNPMPTSAIADLAKAVPDDLVRDIVKDLRAGPGVPGWLPPSRAEPVVRGTGWQSQPKPEDRSRQFAMFDQMVDAMVGGPNDTSKLRS
jgi:hypothetical protein